MLKKSCQCAKQNWFRKIQRRTTEYRKFPIAKDILFTWKKEFKTKVYFLNISTKVFSTANNMLSKVFWINTYAFILHPKLHSTFSLFNHFRFCILLCFANDVSWKLLILMILMISNTNTDDIWLHFSQRIFTKTFKGYLKKL